MEFVVVVDYGDFFCDVGEVKCFFDGCIVVVDYCDFLVVIEEVVVGCVG